LKLKGETYLDMLQLYRANIDDEALRKLSIRRVNRAQPQSVLRPPKLFTLKNNQRIFLKIQMIIDENF